MEGTLFPLGDQISHLSLAPGGLSSSGLAFPRPRAVVEHREQVSSPSTPSDQPGPVLGRVDSYPKPPGPWARVGRGRDSWRGRSGFCLAHLQSCSQGFFRADVGEDEGGVGVTDSLWGLPQAP